MAERPGFQIVVAHTAGFCMGVRRAVRMALGAAEEPRYPCPIRTHGPLIHNRQVLQVLESRGIRVLEAGESLGGGTVVIRAHGLSRKERRELQEAGGTLLDATCPHVSHLQRIVKEYAAQGFACIVVGDAGHAEVSAVLSYAGESGYVVSCPEEVDALPPLGKVVVVAQTTQDERVFREVLERARARFPECLSFDTICRSTGMRQAEVRELAEGVDAVIVVGAFHSANTRRLAEISRSTGVPTFHVETDRQLDLDAVLRHRTVGLTAGASTPRWMIRRVIRRLHDEHVKRTSLGGYVARTFVRGVVNSNVFAAGAAAALTYGCSRLLPRPPGLLSVCVAVTALFVLGQHLLNQYGRRESLYLSEPARADFFMANERALVLLGTCSSGLAVFLAWFLGAWAFGLVLVGTAAGLMYRFRMPDALGRRIGVRSLEQLPGSKEVFVGLAWGAMAGLVPALAAEGGAATWRAGLVAFAVAGLLSFQRSLALDLRAVAADQIFGRETLAGTLGVRAAQRLLLACAPVVAALVVLSGVAGWTTGFWLPLLLCVPWIIVSFLVLRLRGRPDGALTEALVDGGFYVLGAAGWLWSWAGAS